MNFAEALVLCTLIIVLGILGWKVLDGFDF